MWDGDIKDINKIALYINAELSKGRTQKDIEINDFKVNERVIEKKLKRKGYKKINNQYVLENSNNKEYDNSNTSVTTKEPKVISRLQEDKRNKYDNNMTIVTKDKYDNSNTLVINDINIKNNLLELAKNYNKILRIIERYDKEYDKEYDSIVIELPVETIKDFRTSIRVNNIIWEQFNTFANEHKEFTKRDLLSQALKEYIENHK